MNAINYLKQLKELLKCKASSNKLHPLREINGEASEIFKIKFNLNILRLNLSSSLQY
jgi:hypothetical protein